MRDVAIGRGSKLLIGVVTLLAATAFACGTGVVAAAATRASTAAAPALSSSPPSDCAAELSSAQSTSSGTPVATKTFTQSVVSGSTTTYFFTITSTRQSANQPPGGATYTNLEDCAYANGNPANIKYGVQASNPPFSGGQVTTTLTVDSADTVCDRVAIDGTSAGIAFTDYTNLVGTGGGAALASACGPSGNLPEAPATGMIALAGIGVAAAAAYVWRRRDAADVIED